MACGACSFLKRKCVPGCIFALYFSSDIGVEQFRAIHSVFGASNFSKLLQKVPEDKRSDAVATILFEAEARIENPIHGCLANVFALYKEVEKLKKEVMACHAQLAAGGRLNEGSLTAAQYVNNNQSHMPPATTNNYYFLQCYTPPYSSLPTQWDTGSLTASSAQQMYFPPPPSYSSSVPVSTQWDISSPGGGIHHQQHFPSPPCSSLQWEVSSLGRDQRK